MKKYIKYLLVVFICIVAASCRKDELNPNSQIFDSTVAKNDLDKWLEEHYLAPYNIDFKYRMERNESNKNYWLVPAEYEKSVMMARLMLYLCIEPYDEVTGSLDFIRTYYPKMIHLIGSAAYNNNNTMILGTAEGGLKITIYYVNSIQIDPEFLNHYYFKTMHHEFAHILNQKKPYSTDFDQISGPDYVTDAWNTAWEGGDDGAQAAGFISTYASSEAREDFVELVAIYVTHDQAYWDNIIRKAGSGGDIISAKFDIVYNYMLSSWNIDLNELRAVILERQAELDNMDFTTLN